MFVRTTKVRIAKNDPHAEYQSQVGEDSNPLPHLGIRDFSLSFEAAGHPAERAEGKMFPCNNEVKPLHFCHSHSGYCSMNGNGDTSTYRS